MNVTLLRQNFYCYLDVDDGDFPLDGVIPKWPPPSTQTTLSNFSCLRQLKLLKCGGHFLAGCLI